MIKYRNKCNKQLFYDYQGKCDEIIALKQKIVKLENEVDDLKIYLEMPFGVNAEEMACLARAGVSDFLGVGNE